MMFKANGTRHEFPLRKERTVVGRTNNCDLRIPLSSVSRQHCEISVADGKVKLRDLGSSNGTYHNSTRVTAAVLKAGDEIVIGPVVFTVVIDGRPAKLEAKRTVINSESASANVTQATTSATREETADAMRSAASALAQVMDDEEVDAVAPLDLSDGDDKPEEPAKDDGDGAPLALDDEPEIPQPETPEAPNAELAGSDDQDVLTLAGDDELSAPPVSAKPEALELEDDEPLPSPQESEAYSPTTELDDPIAALSKMVGNKGDDEVLLLPDDEEDDDDDKKKKPSGKR